MVSHSVVKVIPLPLLHGTFCYELPFDSRECVGRLFLPSRPRCVFGFLPFALVAGDSSIACLPKSSVYIPLLVFSSGTFSRLARIVVRQIPISVTHLSASVDIRLKSPSSTPAFDDSGNVGGSFGSFAF